MSENQKVKIYYLASGNISIPILKWIMSSDDLELCGIGSQLKASKGTGPKRTVQGPIVTYCEANNIPVSRFVSVNTDEFHELMLSLGVELLVVASFGQILKEKLLYLPKYGCLNVHASLLPKYRGASPIVASLLNGDSKTGVTFMQMEKGLDTGPIYRMEELEILPSDNSDTLEERLGELAGQHISEVIVDIARNGLKPTPQPDEGSCYAPKINKEDGIANWHEQTARHLECMVRAYSPWPSVKAYLPTKNGKPKMVKITEASAIETYSTGAEPGDILAFGKCGIVIACREGALRITRVTPEGKKDMPAKDYLLGTPIPPGNQAVVAEPGHEALATP